VDERGWLLFAPQYMELYLIGDFRKRTVDNSLLWEALL
jgi:hypothetical protein